ncbi:MAG: hypothetical protein JW943_12870 [Deltaproteobacteria bacterium]|nr:hypothetical protein [Deltaproteobacteria bacterium]
MKIETIMNIFIICIITISIMVMSAIQSFALSVDTHKAINIYIADPTKGFHGYSLDNYLKNNLGLSDGVTAKFDHKMVQDWISDGGEYEDDHLRLRNHFHNPINDQGLSPGPYFSALNWALKPIGAQGAESYSWNDVRSYYYQALTANDKTARERFFAETFRGLGQVMHLVQDMSVPAHVRNDWHPFLEGYENWFLNPVAVPRAPSINNDLQPVNYLPQSTAFLIPNLFDTGQYSGYNPGEAAISSTGIGLAEYTNANFFSDDTIIYNDFTYPQIDSGNRHMKSYTGPLGQYDREYYLKNCMGEAYCNSNPPDKNYQGYLLAAVDYFDYWRQIRALPESEYPPVPSLDENVFHDYSKFLIPRAIGYSSQVLSYFFRGKLDVEMGDGSLKVKNASTETMTDGHFELYYDDENGVRTPVENIANAMVSSLAPGGDPQTITFTPPTESESSYMLVYRGKLGSESGTVIGKYFFGSNVFYLRCTFNGTSPAIGGEVVKIDNGRTSVSIAVQPGGLCGPFSASLLNGGYASVARTALNPSRTIFNVWEEVPQQDAEYCIKTQGTATDHTSGDGFWLYGLQVYHSDYEGEPWDTLAWVKRVQWWENATPIALCAKRTEIIDDKRVIVYEINFAGLCLLRRTVQKLLSPGGNYSSCGWVAPDPMPAPVISYPDDVNSGNGALPDPQWAAADIQDDRFWPFIYYTTYWRNCLSEPVEISKENACLLLQDGEATYEPFSIDFELLEVYTRVVVVNEDGDLVEEICESEDYTWYTEMRASYDKIDSPAELF